MEICIHGGTKQIGGSCVVLESGGKRLLIDSGLPLDAEFCQAAVAFPKMMNDIKSAKIYSKIKRWLRHLVSRQEDKYGDQVSEKSTLERLDA